MAEFNNSTNNTVVTGTYENDYVSNKGTMVTIQALGGNDTVYTEYANDVTIYGGDGADSLRNYKGNNVYIAGDAGNDRITIYGTANALDGGAGSDVISNDGENALINGGDDNDTIGGSGRNSTVYGGNGIDIIGFGGANVRIYGEAGNDSISGSHSNATISGGDGEDYIESNYNDNGSISGGTGDDTVTTYQGNNISILGGAGNDQIHISDSTSCVIEYSVGDGNDTISRRSYYGGFSEDDTLKIAGGSYTTQVSGNDVIVNVGTGSILLSYAAGLSTLNIQTVPAGSFGDTTSTSTTTTPSTGTSQVISNYTGEPVTVSGFMGASFSGNNFVVNSSAGTLTIQNVMDKIVDLRDGAGNEFVKAYKASAAGVVDGRGINSYEIIEGSSAGMDVIFAGDGGSQLWGGSGTSADAIAGGNGSDIFIGGRYQGADVFYSASSADFVNLTDATLSDIVAAVEVNGNIAIGFNTGNIVTIQSTELLSAAVNLADGSSWRFNHVTKGWQSA